MSEPSPTSVVRFWGVRGSVPTPLSSAELGQKNRELLLAYQTAGSPLRVDEFFASQRQEQPPTYGGNTSCVEVRCGTRLIVLDMGTGIRPLGNSLFPEMSAQGGLEIAFVVSHMHWDHLQGIPFFDPLYAKKEEGIENHWHFYGGTAWQEPLEQCLREQMRPPFFPVDWREIEQTTAEITYATVHDGMAIEPFPNCPHAPHITFGKLEHPQDSYGARIVMPDGKILCYTTDYEPRDPLYPSRRVLELAENADVWITDCQYTKNMYEGVAGGPPRHGWGHSYPEAVAEAAARACVKRVVLFHHDPTSNDAKIKSIEHTTKTLLDRLTGKDEISVIAAHEGLKLPL